jgi:hypothetical protein
MKNLIYMIMTKLEEENARIFHHNGICYTFSSVHYRPRYLTPSIQTLDKRLQITRSLAEIPFQRNQRHNSMQPIMPRQAEKEKTASSSGPSFPAHLRPGVASVSDSCYSHLHSGHHSYPSLAF